MSRPSLSGATGATRTVKVRAKRKRARRHERRTMDPRTRTPKAPSAAERRELDALRAELAIHTMREAVEAARLEATAKAEARAQAQAERTRKGWMCIIAIVALVALAMGNATAGASKRQRTDAQRFHLNHTSNTPSNPGATR